MSAPPDHDPAVQEAESILQRLADRPIDDDYYTVRDSAPSQFAKALTGVVAALFGLLLTVAAVQTRNDRPATETERAALIENIGVRQDLVDSKRDTVERLHDEIAELEAASTVEGPGASALRVAAGAGRVRGPGVRVVARSADDEELPGSRLTDTDVQLIVNGLWLAGAEAVSVNGHRLTSTSAIRAAGEAVTVNFRSVTEPIEITAIGDAGRLATAWREGPSGRYLRARAEADGIRYTVAGSDEVELKAAPEARLTVSAEPIRRSAS